MWGKPNRHVMTKDRQVSFIYGRLHAAVMAGRVRPPRKTMYDSASDSKGPQVVAETIPK